MGKSLKYEGAQYEYSSYIEGRIVIISRCAISSLHCLLKWPLTHAQLLQVVQQFQECKRWTHMLVSLCLIQSSQHMSSKERWGGGGSLLSLALLLESSFSSKLRDSKHWAEDTAEADCQHEMWVTFSVYLEECKCINCSSVCLKFKWGH
jgi:hypothetical protein